MGRTEYRKSDDRIINMVAVDEKRWLSGESFVYLPRAF